MGLSWQQGPLGGRPVGRFLVEQPLPERMLFAEPARRRMRVKFADEWISPLSAITRGLSAAALSSISTASRAV